MKKDIWEGMTIRIRKVHRVKSYNGGDDSGRGYTYCGIQVGPAVLVDPAVPSCKSCVKAYGKKSQNAGSVNRKSGKS